MNQPNIEEQLKAIEAAIHLAQTRNLPAVVPFSQPATRENTYDGHDPSKAREIALTILKKVDERMVHTERVGMELQQQQSELEGEQQEHKEAIELISGEVAALKERSSLIERHLRHLHVQPVLDQNVHNQQDWRQGYRIIWMTLGALLLTLLIVFALIKKV